MRNEVIAEQPTADGGLDLRTLYLLSPREVEQFKRTNLRPHRERNESVLTEVHHVLNAARASTVNRRVIRRRDGAALTVDGTWVDDDDDVDSYQFQYEEVPRDLRAEINSILGWKGALLERQLAKSEAVRRVQRTTLNLQVGAAADDARFSMTTGVGTDFSATTGSDKVGHSTVASHDVVAGTRRFTGVSGLSGATVNTATMSLWGKKVDAGTALTKIFADDVAAPTAPTSLAEAQALESAVTTAAVDWDSPGLSVSAFTASPSIVSVIQELADSYDPSVIQIVHLDDGSSTAAANSTRASLYAEASAEAPKLDIDYTAAGLSIPVAQHHRQRNF